MKFLAMLLAAGVLTACGGGSGGGSYTTPPTTPVATCTPFADSFGRTVSCADMNALAGANLGFLEGGSGDGSGGSAGDGGADGGAGDGAPIANTALKFVDINGKEVNTTTDGTGYFRISLRGMKAPLVATVMRATKPWKSMLVQDIVRAPANRKFYTINLTGLTDVVASAVAKADGLTGAQALTPAAVARQKALVPAIITAVNTSISPQITAAGLNPTTFDPLAAPFQAVATDSYDKLLESVVITKDPTTGNSVVTPKYSINPATPSIAPGASIDLSANFNASFSVTGGSASGTLVSTGSANARYTAPSTPGVYQVVATSAADPTIKAFANITVSAGSGFRISGNPRIAPNTTTQFTAFVNDVASPATWTIAGNCGSCTIDSNGLFTAGSSVTTVTVRGTNNANSSLTATAQLTIASAVILTVNAPSAPSMTTADMLTASTGISPSGIDASVTWTTGPGSAAGTVVPVEWFYGYLPPATPGTYTVTAASVADPSKTAALSVQVTAAPGATLGATSGTPASMRYGHAAAILGDGRVLLVGGQADRQGQVSALTTDVFSPASASFSAGPALSLPRVSAEAVAIDANRVLVSGGKDDYQTARKTAEVLNLSNGTTTAAANTMSVLRIHHRMVALSSGPNSGKILIIGGFNGPVPYGVPSWLATSSVDLFDPISNNFTAANNGLLTSRGLFTATPLLDGRILIVGGYQPDPGAGALASVEIYDPTNGSFSYTGSLSIARYGHTATRLADGKVLIVGGDQNVGARSTAELYNPATGTFSNVTSTLAVLRSNHAAALLGDGRVLVFGGESGESVVNGTVEAYDPATQTFSLFARMSIPRTRATATVLTSGPNAGKILVFGGGAVNQPAKAAEMAP